MDEQLRFVGRLLEGKKMRRIPTRYPARRKCMSKGEPTMTEAELWELMAANVGNGSSMFSALLTLIFAYLATAYLVGRKLTVFQTLIVSALFIWGAGMAALSVHGNMNRALWFVQQLARLHPDESFLLNRSFIHSFSIMAALSIAVSLYFMYRVRRNPKLDTGSV